MSESCRIFGWDDAWNYVEGVIEQECAEQGMSVRITDPSQLAFASQLLRAGKRHRQTTWIEPPSGATAG